MSYKKYNPIVKRYCILLCLTISYSNAMIIERQETYNKKSRQLPEKELNQKFRTLIENCNYIKDIKLIIATYLLNEPDKINRFMETSIGKALEWYTFTRTMSRGRAIYTTPLFKGLFEQKNLIFSYWKESDYTIPFMLWPMEQHTEVHSQQYGRPIHFCDISDKGTICRIFDHINNEISGSELDYFLDTIAAQLFMLSKSEILTLIQLGRKENTLLQSDINNIQALNNKIAVSNRSEFLKWNKTFCVRSLNIYGAADVAFTLFVFFIPALGISSCIKQWLSLNAIIVAEENHLISLVNTLITQSQDKRLTKYLYPLVDNDIRELFNFLKINSPFFLGFLPAFHTTDTIKESLSVGSIIISHYFLVSLCISEVKPITTLKEFSIWCGFLIGCATLIEIMRFCYKIYKNEHWTVSGSMGLEEITKIKYCVWNGGRIL